MKYAEYRTDIYPVAPHKELIRVADGRLYDAAYLAAAVETGALKPERVVSENAADSNFRGVTIPITFRDYGVIVVGDVGKIENDVDSRIGGIPFARRVHEEVGVQQKIRNGAGDRELLQSHRIALETEVGS